MPTAHLRPPVASPTAGFDSVFDRLHPHLAELDHFLREQLAAFEPEIRDLADYCLAASGKRIRPALVFLSGWTGEDRPAPDLVKVAAVVELVHLATLVHDDIMDAADLRRGRDTASRQFGPEAAVLLGDALFAHALHLAAEFPTTEICRTVAASTRKVCAGEIVQTLRRHTANITLGDYYRVIELKTAELFRVSCHLGARLGGHSPEFTGAAAEFGRQLGIAYQIYDDLVDFYGEEERIGKTLGTDFHSGKLTLPLLVLEERLDGPDRAALLEEITGQRPPDLAGRRRQMVRHGVFAVVNGSIESALAVGEAALAPHAGLPPVPWLRQLDAALRVRVASLQPSV